MRMSLSEGRLYMVMVSGGCAGFVGCVGRGGCRNSSFLIICEEMNVRFYEKSGCTAIDELWFGAWMGCGADSKVAK
jgi:hypothetical protein